jgi:CheY-like chemotaxis protein
MNTPTDRPFVIYVDDDEDDRMLFCDAFKTTYPAIDCIDFQEAIKALSFLSEQKNNGRLPQHIVVDVNMPVMDGYEFTKELRKDDVFLQVPLTYFSTSARPTFLLLSSNNTYYRQKPAEFSAYEQIIKEMMNGQPENKS